MESRQTKITLSLAISLFLAACSLTGTGASPTAPPEGSGGEEGIATHAPAPTVEESLPTQEVSGGGVAGAGGPCDNPYYPVVDGATWTYSSDAGDLGVVTWTDTITDVRSDGFTLTSQFDDLTRTQEWECRGEGLVSLQYEGGPSAGISTGGMEATYETTSVTGVSIPASISPGDTWSQSYTFTSTVDMGEAGTSTSSGTVQMDFEAIGEESVTVPAGTFTAMKVQIEITFDLTSTVSGVTVPISMTVTSTAWYALGVGLVKSIDQSDVLGEGVTTTVELTSYSIP